MVVPTGTASPWRELTFSDTGREATYIRDGWVTESADLLAEALRADGVVATLSTALRAAEEAILDACFYGYVDGSHEETLCNFLGIAENGETVDKPLPCVVAVVDTRE